MSKNWIPAACVLAALALGGTLTACDRNDTAGEKVGDAFDARDNEKLKDAGENMGDAARDAGEAVKEGAEEVKEDIKD